MTDDALAWVPATELVELYRRGEASPVQAAQAVLARVEQVGPTLNAFCHLDPEATLAAARASERRYREGSPAGPVDGVPTSVKDQLLTRGWPTRRGSRTTAVEAGTPIDQAWPDDSPAVARLREQGAVLVGKTTTPEFGWKGVTDSPLTGVTRNPWDPSTTPGGSSGGASAAVAAGMGQLALGTDGAGSVRIPAAFAGVVGLKATFAQVPVYPSSAFGTLSHTGPLTRTVADTALLLDVISAPDPRDPWAVPPPAVPFREQLLDDRGEPRLDGLRMAFSPTLGYVDVDPEVAAAVQAAVEVLRDLGAKVELVDPGFGDPLGTLEALWCAGAAALLRGIPGSMHELVDPGLRAMAERGERLTGVDVTVAGVERTRLGAQLTALHRRYPVLVTPTMPIPAFMAGQEVPAGWPSPAWTSWTPFTYPFNLTQQPALSVPCGFTSAGLPVGVQLVADRFADALVLRVGHAYQLATDWHHRRPPV
jgi:aspartyl-tRNA(Asn)/glutamyl-tRNA(Gln) amidotransferase subunit A